MRATNKELAVFGGYAVRNRKWPKWPLTTPAIQRNLLEVLHSGKWAISGYSEASDTFERRISTAFAKYVNRNYCVACSSGSAALFIALGALGIGPGDEVILTGLTWVACPGAVVRLGACPILVDIGSEGLCASASDVESAITSRTRAILMIHMYSSICNIDEYVDLSNRYSIALVEDGSQAHGASWRGRKIGSFGEISIFSTQQSKLLTSGEGGLCTTDDPVLYQRMQQLRADGRQYRMNPFYPAGTIAPDGYELEAAGDVIGQNLSLSEFQSALLFDGLDRLDRENGHRQVCVEKLADYLASTNGVKLIVPGAEVDRPTYYRLAMRVDRSEFADLTAQEIVPALFAELGADVRRVDAPLNRHPLYVPTKFSIAADNPELRKALEPTQFELPRADSAYQEVVTFPHQILLADPEEMGDVADAMEKIRRCALTLKARSNELEIHSEV